MKYCLILSIVLIGLAACGNPSLKWIGTPEDSRDDFTDFSFKGINDPGLLENRGRDTSGTHTIRVNLNPARVPGSGAPYTSPVWRLDGESCDNIGDISAGFNGQPYVVSSDFITIYIDTPSLTTGTHEVEVIVTGAGGSHYTGKETVMVD
jgi:hypothetical protein